VIVLIASQTPTIQCGSIGAELKEETDIGRSTVNNIQRPCCPFGFNRDANTTGLSTEKRYFNSGLDHLVIYRPGTGTIWILQNQLGLFTPVFQRGNPGSGNGIGGYDLSSSTDRIFAFDYGHTGRQNYLSLYRPGTGTIWILQRFPDGVFRPVYNQGKLD